MKKTLVLALIASSFLTGCQFIPACNEEDGSGQEICYWNGETMGNGTGASYIVDNR